MGVEAQESGKPGYAVSAISKDQSGSGSLACSASRIGETAVGRNAGGGGPCLDGRSGASALGKKLERQPRAVSIEGIAGLVGRKH